jgi:preprotein translocase subunit SecG
MEATSNSKRLGIVLATVFLVTMILLPVVARAAGDTPPQDPYPCDVNNQTAT